MTTRREPWCGPLWPGEFGWCPRVVVPVTGPLAERFYRNDPACQCFGRLSVLVYWPPPGVAHLDDDEGGDDLMAWATARVAEMDAAACARGARRCG